MRLLITSLFLTAFFTFSVKAQVVINEYSCSNINGPTDAYGQREDWVELYNTSGTAINLVGYFLSDDKFTPQKWAVPSAVNIPANGRIMVYCSNRNLVNGSQLHPNFSLTQMKGEYIVLSNPSGTIIDSVHLIPTQADHSRGRKTDGNSQWGLFDNPTPNTTNAGAKNNYATKPIFSVAPGFYTTNQTLTISSPDPNVQIHFTLDGSAPNASSTTYTVPIPIAATTVVRAYAISSDPLVLPSFNETNTYFINETVAPTMNIISVAGNYAGMFGNSFPQTNTSFEFFEYTNHQFKFEFEGMAHKHGNDSWSYPQKGFRIYTKDEYGYDWAMKYKFFNNSTRDTFRQIILKAAASDNYNGNGGPSCHLRDAFVHTLSLKYNLDLDQRRYSPTVVFVNGQYWGIYEIREKVNGDYFDYYYGQSNGDKVDHLSYWGGLQIRSGSDTGWVNLYNFIMTNNMAVPANYAYVTQYLDVKSFITYFIYNTWLVDTDWLNWNTMWWRGRKGQGVKWRYVLWDEDNVLSLGQNYTGMGTVTYQNDPCQPFNLFQNNSSIKHTDMLVHLMANPAFDQLYRSTFLEMLDGPLDCAHAIPQFDSLIHIIDPEMQRHCNRWGGSYTTWQSHLAYMRSQILGRCQVIAQKLDSCMQLNPQKLQLNVQPAGAGTISINGTSIGPYVWGKSLDADTVINLAATPSNGYYFFDHWEKYVVTNSMTPDSMTSPVSFSFKKKDSVIAYFRYLNPDSLQMTFDVNPSGKGTISLNGVAITTYPFTTFLDRRITYNISATPTNNYKFFLWRKNKTTTSFIPTGFDNTCSLKFNEKDTIIANFVYEPAVGNMPNAPEPSELNQTITFPTAFSPNDDNLNDRFRLIKGKDIKSFDLKIYNRWGELVFSTSNATDSWDGTYKGIPCEIGTYFYVVYATFDNDIQNVKRIFKGEINLIR
jgi:gliding motility-associated-like protein